MGVVTTPAVGRLVVTMMVMVTWEVKAVYGQTGNQAIRQSVKSSHMPTINLLDSNISYER